MEKHTPQNHRKRYEVTKATTLKFSFSCTFQLLLTCVLLGNPSSRAQTFQRASLPSWRAPTDPHRRCRSSVRVRDRRIRRRLRMAACNPVAKHPGGTLEQQHPHPKDGIVGLDEVLHVYTYHSPDGPVKVPISCSTLLKPYFDDFDGEATARKYLSRWQRGPEPPEPQAGQVHGGDAAAGSRGHGQGVCALLERPWRRPPARAPRCTSASSSTSMACLCQLRRRCRARAAARPRVLHQAVGDALPHAAAASVPHRVLDGLPRPGLGRACGGGARPTGCSSTSTATTTCSTGSAATRARARLATSRSTRAHASAPPSPRWRPALCQLRAEQVRAVQRAASPVRRDPAPAVRHRLQVVPHRADPPEAAAPARHRGAGPRRRGAGAAERGVYMLAHNRWHGLTDSHAKLPLLLSPPT